MLAIRRFIFLLACFSLLGKDANYAYALSDKLALQLKQKNLNKGNDFLNPLSINDSAKLLLVEIEEIEDDTHFCLSVIKTFKLNEFDGVKNETPVLSYYINLVINRVVLFCSLKIDC